MINPDHLRNRKTVDLHAGILKITENSGMRLRRLPTRAKFILCLAGFLSFIFYGGVLFWKFSTNDLAEESFLEVDKCPACYGTSMCRTLLDYQVEFSGISRFRIFDFINVKNVHFAAHKNSGEKIVVKKLGHDKELKEVDDWICREADRQPGCDIARVSHKTNVMSDILNKGLQIQHLKGVSQIFSCPTYRLIDRIMLKYKEKIIKKSPALRMPDKIQLYTTAKINPEPIILQIFPAEEGWPFPQYIGACGRYIVESYAGRPISEFFNSPFQQRADIAYQIFKMAEQLTNNLDEFALYWSDLSFENFAVDEAGKVRLVDVEHIVLVDKQSISAVKPKGWNEFQESQFDDCEDNCLTFDVENMCSHVFLDHNYYAACRNILSKYANEPSYVGGLLHDIPKLVEEKFDLTYLLNECTSPGQPQGRYKVKERLLSALNKARDYEHHL